MAKIYTERKKNFDDMVYGYLIKRLVEPVKSSDSYGNGHVDEFGNEINGEEDWSYTKLDKLVFDLKAMLGPNVGKIAAGAYQDIDTLSLMTGLDTDGYGDRFRPVVSLVEEASYLPASTRGFDGIMSDDSELSKAERVQFAMTVASFMMMCLRKDRMVTEQEFDDHVLNATEATFGVRAIGSYGEVLDYLKKAKLADSRDLSRDGIVLLSRIAMMVGRNGLCVGDGSHEDDMSASWRKLGNHVG